MNKIERFAAGEIVLAANGEKLQDKLFAACGIGQCSKYIVLNDGERGDKHTLYMWKEGKDNFRISYNEWGLPFNLSVEELTAEDFEEKAIEKKEDEKMENEMPELKPGMVISGKFKDDDGFRNKYIGILLEGENSLFVIYVNSKGRIQYINHIQNDEIDKIYKIKQPDIFPDILSNGNLELIWQRKVEFAKPIRCETMGQDYKYVNSVGNIAVAIWTEYSLDYYRRKAGNMFAPDAVIPQEQIDKIVADMKGEK